ncbi:hypothetical protein QF047_004320 [Arthrobacter sp. W4I7]|nr:hypothetical protein [Arthrobacter sp. W4I7]
MDKLGITWFNRRARALELGLLPAAPARSCARLLGLALGPVVRCSPRHGTLPSGARVRASRVTGHPAPHKGIVEFIASTSQRRSAVTQLWVAHRQRVIQTNTLSLDDAPAGRCYCADRVPLPVPSLTSGTGTARYGQTRLAFYWRSTLEGWALCSSMHPAQTTAPKHPFHPVPSMALFEGSWAASPMTSLG